MTLNMTILLARYYADKHHPLAQGIKPSEITPLVTSLQCRWAEAGVKPELAQEGLEGLRRAATAYAQHAAQRGQPFTEEDHLRIIRELAAFHGSRLLQDSGGKWDNPDSLLNLAVADPRLCMFRSDTGEYKVRRLAYHVGWMAAKIWETALAGDSDSQITVITHTWR